MEKPTSLLGKGFLAQPVEGGGESTQLCASWDG